MRGHGPINVERISKLFEEIGFSRIDFVSEHTLTFARRADDQKLWRVLSIAKSSETRVWVWSEVSLTCCGWRPENLGEFSAVAELGGFEGRAEIELASDAAANEWEKRVTEIAPEKNVQLYLEKGSAVLSKYENTFIATDRYVDCFKRFLSTGIDYEESFPLGHRDKTDDLAQSIGLCKVPKLLPAYRFAVAVILQNCGEVDGDPHMYDDVFPLYDKDFLARVRIVVNEILMSREEVMKMRDRKLGWGDQETCW